MVSHQNARGAVYFMASAKHTSRVVWGYVRLSHAVYGWHAWAPMRELLYKRAHTLIHWFLQNASNLFVSLPPKEIIYSRYFSYLPPTFHWHQIQPSAGSLWSLQLRAHDVAYFRARTASVKRKTRPKFQYPRMPRFFCANCPHALPLKLVFTRPTSPSTSGFTEGDFSSLMESYLYL